MCSSLMSYVINFLVVCQSSEYPNIMFFSISQEFPFDVTEINWDTYISNYCIGIKRYLMNEDLSNLPQARKKIAR